MPVCALPPLPAHPPMAITIHPPKHACSHATDAVYLICNELSGDSTIIALRPADGAPAWTLSTSSLAAALTPVRAAAAAESVFLYADTGANLTALSAADGALLWRVNIAALVPSSLAGASVTHLELVGGDTLLVRRVLLRWLRCGWLLRWAAGCV